MSPWLPLLAALVACAPGPREGVAVGNPGKGMTMRVSAAPDVADLTGSIELDALTAVGCDGRLLDLADQVVLSLAGDSRLLVPAGSYCGLRAELSGPVSLTGRTPSGTFDLLLDVDRIDVAGSTAFEVDAHGLLLMLGPDGWLTTAALGPGDDVRVEPGSARHDALAALIRERSLLCEDHDDDGRRDPDDRVVAAGPGFDAGPARSPMGR